MLIRTMKDYIDQQAVTQKQYNKNIIIIYELKS